MATQTFAYVYQLTETGVLAGAQQGAAENPFLDVTIDSGDDSTLDLGEAFAVAAPGIGEGTAKFVFASDDGFVAWNPTTDTFFWLTNTQREGDEMPPNSGADYVVCFLAGTMIATPEGEAAIETLKAGDLVLTSDGAARPVRWLARQTVSTLFADPLKVMPVLVRAGALGENLPLRDLFVSPDHALMIDGVLVQAGALVNDGSILRHAAMPRTFVYYHVELEDHSLVLAEGVPAETFIDNVARRAFDNWEEAPEAAIAELDLPRVKSARQLPAAIRARLEDRMPAVAA